MNIMVRESSENGPIMETSGPVLLPNVPTDLVCPHSTWREIAGILSSIPFVIGIVVSYIVEYVLTVIRIVYGHIHHNTTLCSLTNTCNR